MYMTSIELLPLRDVSEGCAPQSVDAITPEAADGLARQLKALADPTRLRLVSMVAAHPASDTEIRALSAWQEGELLFDGEPLSVAVTEFNRYLPTPMLLERPEIGTVRLGGRFLTNDPTEFLKSLRLNFGIQARLGHGKIELYR